MRENCPLAWTVYCLKDPRTQEARYVGWTSKTVRDRLSAHISEALSTFRCSRTSRAGWVRSLLNIGRIPAVDILETGTGDDWAIAEQKWIAHFLGRGAPLTNGTKGGEGHTGYHPPPEVQGRITQSHRKPYRATRATDTAKAGMRFGRLTVQEDQRTTISGRRFVHCICDCGTDLLIAQHRLTNSATQSCGCFRTERCRLLNRAHGEAHGRISTEYRIWHGMKNRCLNPAADAFENYGGRGISICNEWKDDFSAFVASVGRRPLGTTLDRIDNNGNYEPGNVRWATSQTQNRNKRTSTLITCDGITRTLAEWVETTGIKRTTISQRIKRGRTPAEALGIRGCNYVKAAGLKASTPTLFDLLEAEEAPVEEV